MNAVERDACVLDLCLMAFRAIDRVMADLGVWQDLETAVSSRRANCLAAAGRQSYFWALPIFSCLVVGGTREQAIPLSAAWILFDLASDILDDIYDQDKPHEPWMRWGAERATLVSTGALFLGQRLVNELDCAPQTVVAIQNALAGAGLIAARSQAISTKPDSVQQYFERIGGNTAQVLGAIVQAGGRLVTNEERWLKNLFDYGVALGTLLQLVDDCLDMRRVDSRGDLAHGHLTLPVLLALSQREHPHHPEFAQVLDGILAEYSYAKEVRLNQLLWNMDVWQTIRVLAKVYEQKALEALRGFPSSATDYLTYYATQAFLSFSRT